MNFGKTVAFLLELLGHPDINDDFMDLKANFIIPFIFREKIFVFLGLLVLRAGLVGLEQWE